MIVFFFNNLPYNNVRVVVVPCPSQDCFCRIARVGAAVCYYTDDNITLRARLLRQTALQKCIITFL